MSPAPAAFRDSARLNVDVHTKTDQKLTSSRQGILIKTSPSHVASECGQVRRHRRPGEEAHAR